MPGQEPLKGKTVNTHAPVDHTDDDTVNSTIPTRHQSKQNPKPVLFFFKCPEENAAELADTPLLET